jgi:glycosyltransferase involved in cell wall biosynthesis
MRPHYKAMPEPLVSFVVPCYNYGQYLPDCLRTILGQAGNYDLEVIAIDDCSTDNTAEILASFAQHRRVRVIRHAKNQGHVITVSEGLAAARGRFVARIDPDDRYRLNFLKTLLPRFETSPAVGMVYGDAAVIDKVGKLLTPRCDQVHGGRDFVGNELVRLLEKNYICAPTAIARREAWQRFLPVWEGLAFNDWYFNVLMAREYDFCYVHEVVADYRVHGSNHHSRIVIEKKEESSIFRVLDWVYAHPEKDPALQTAKMKARRRIYAAQYLDQAEKYFGVGYTKDARRCYLRAFRHAPSCVLRPGIARRFLATLTNRRAYDWVKTRVLGKQLQTAPARSA